MEVLAWVDTGRVVLEASGHADEWTAAERRAVLAELGRVERLVAAVRGKVVTAEREAGTWSLRGDRDLAGFVGRESHQGRGAGLAVVGQAGTLAAMPQVAEALVDGPVTTTHVAQITRATSASPALAVELATHEGQKQIVELASRLDGAQFGKALAQMSASLDPATRQRSHDEQRANRSLVWTHTPSGTLVKARLDSVSGHKFAKVIDALCPRPALDDDRSREQRQADALVVMAENAATDKGMTPGALAPVQAVVTFTQETWTALRAVGAGCAGATPGAATDVIGRLRGADPVVDETGQAWPASEVARALCDCALTWAMVGTPSADLNLGRESRCFRRQHWMALHAAGITSCSIDGCGMPLAYTELHHLRWWHQHGGRTDIANCLPYCSYHHHEIHRLGITVTRRADGAVEHRYPDGRRYGGAPPPADACGPPATSGAGTGAGPGAADSGVRPDAEHQGEAPPALNGVRGGDPPDATDPTLPFAEPVQLALDLVASGAAPRIGDGSPRVPSDDRGP